MALAGPTPAGLSRPHLPGPHHPNRHHQLPAHQPLDSPAKVGPDRTVATGPNQAVELTERLVRHRVRPPAQRPRRCRRGGDARGRRSHCDRRVLLGGDHEAWGESTLEVAEPCSCKGLRRCSGVGMGRGEQFGGSNGLNATDHEVIPATADSRERMRVRRRAASFSPRPRVMTAIAGPDGPSSRARIGRTSLLVA